MIAQPGELVLDYTAEIELDVYRAYPSSVDEVPINDLPLDILPFLLPSRFVSSDRLAAFAQREFSRAPKGTNGVTGDLQLDL